MTTLTYNPNEVPEGELTAEEQDSLAVGEKAFAEQQELLAGKFRDAEELEKAYIELQKKFGGRSSEQDTAQEEPTEDTEDTEEEEEESSSSILEALWEQGLNGKFEEETLKELSNLSSADLAKMYLEYRAEAERNTAPASDDITDNDLTELREIAGGDNEYSSMMRWAADNLSQQEIDRYDAVMGNGDKNAMTFAVEALFSRYQDAVGVEGQLLTGKPTATTKDVFRSQAEVVRAMSDPRYDNDPAYRQDVFAKLERSNLDY
jgi:hypothetical protein